MTKPKRVRVSGKHTRTAEPRLGAWRRVPLAAAVSAALAGVAAPAIAQDQAQTSVLGEVLVTAQKRTENLQDVPLSIQAFGTEQLEELNIVDFADYVKYLPSVSYTSFGPGFSVAYFRGVASGENNNHSGPQPTVGMYLDEMPITTIQGALDVHLYDIQRVEALAGPQGTLYGASSMAGTIRIITNKPDSSAFQAGYSLEASSIGDGAEGYIGEGFVNIPLGERAAVRLVGWYREDGGYIDNVPATRTFPTSGGCISNFDPPDPGCAVTENRAEDDYNDAETYGARAALRIDLSDTWTLTPVVMGQKQTTNGSFAFNPDRGDLSVARFYPEHTEDEWVQASLTLEGKIGNFDLVYAGGYLTREDTVDSDYSDYSYFYDTQAGYGSYWYDDDGIPLADPSQFINGADDYKRQSHELRISSPVDNRLRFVGGVFYQRQEHDIFQNYQIRGLGVPLEVTGWEDTIWLTNQKRIDRDWAVFGELTYDITDALSVTGGFRTFESDNSLKGFFGFSSAYSDNYGEDLCFSDEPFNGSPCTNLDASVKESSTVPKVNFTYRFDDQKLMYATYSRGFRPGGINRNGTVPPFKPDYLTNYELGWKSTLGGRVRLNGAVFMEQWDDIQFSFLPPSGSGLTVIRNAGEAEILGVEADIQWAASERLMISTGFSYIDAQLTEDYVPDPDEPPTAPDGTRLPVTPEFKANLTARFTFQMGELDAYVQGSGVYQTESFADLQTEDRDILGEQPAYGIADFTAGIGRDSWSLDLYLNNAFDKRAEVFKFAVCATDVCGVSPNVITNQPRTFGVKFGQRF
ncbi:MAG TPA: TonB-dependent receptor [Steroidobacteraceae bacterium]|nr:TonB-dependent receptor [Steroidobacteraceae bacterium]